MDGVSSQKHFAVELKVWIGEVHSQKGMVLLHRGTKKDGTPVAD
jgi:hypothetical protein